MRGREAGAADATEAHATRAAKMQSLNMVVCMI